MNSDPRFEALLALREGKELSSRADAGAVKDIIVAGRSAPWEGLRTIGVSVILEPTVSNTRLTAIQLELAYVQPHSKTPREVTSHTNALESFQIIGGLKLNAPERGEVNASWRVSAWVEAAPGDGSWWVKEGTFVA